MPALIIFGSLFLIILAEELLRRKPKTKGISGGLNWQVKKGVLTVSGKGPMEDFDTGNRAPWGTKIRGIVFEDGVTTIGEYAFANCSRLVSVTIPNNITAVGSHAFAYCTNLETVVIEKEKGHLKLSTAVFPEQTVITYEK